MNFFTKGGTTIGRCIATRLKAAHGGGQSGLSHRIAKLRPASVPSGSAALPSPMAELPFLRRKPQAIPPNRALPSRLAPRLPGIAFAHCAAPRHSLANRRERMRPPKLCLAESQRFSKHRPGGRQCAFGHHQTSVGNQHDLPYRSRLLPPCGLRWELPTGCNARRRIHKRECGQHSRSYWPAALCQTSATLHGRLRATSIPRGCALTCQAQLFISANHSGGNSIACEINALSRCGTVRAPTSTVVTAGF